MRVSLDKPMRNVLQVTKVRTVRTKVLDYDMISYLYFIESLGVYHESRLLTPKLGVSDRKRLHVRSVRTRRTFRHERRDGGRW